MDFRFWINNPKSKIKNRLTLTMYHRPHFLQELQAIREEMSRDCDYDTELFAEMVRHNTPPSHGPARNIRGVRMNAPPNPVAARRATRSRKRKK